MIQKNYPTEQGFITYWINASKIPSKPWLVFLPGLTANHHLFNDQLEHFKGKASLLVWDPPSHGKSRPFDTTWTIGQLAEWLNNLLESEGISNPVLVGQSMGGYISQAFMERFPRKALAFISIDSAPLGRSHYRTWELWGLKHTYISLYMPSLATNSLVRRKRVCRNRQGSAANKKNDARLSKNGVLQAR